MTDREKKFEEHIRSLDGDYNLLKVGDVYIDVETQIEWITWQKAWQAALASQQKSDDDWIDLPGGKPCPLENKSACVEIRLRRGDEIKSHTMLDLMPWREVHTGGALDIIAYRVVKP